MAGAFAKIKLIAVDRRTIEARLCLVARRAAIESRPTMVGFFVYLSY
jgi:hypothetical protein